MQSNPQQLGHYKIIRQQGAGGMAIVYQAYDMQLRRTVAIKVIQTDAIPAEQHDRLLMRFEREAKAQARLFHPNIVQVYDFGIFEGQPFLVMEYIEGIALKEKLSVLNDPLLVLRWLIPVADALNYAHKKGVIHRDVKPANIMLDEKEKPYLTDFGIAKILETDDVTLTGTGLGVGTPEYMAPEQWQDKACEATDQYALGVVLFELLTGQKPYYAETPVALALKQMSEPVPVLTEFAPEISDEVQSIVYRALEVEPGRRFSTMGAMHQALSEAITNLQGKKSSKRKISQQRTQKKKIPQLAEAEQHAGNLIPEKANKHNRMVSLKLLLGILASILIVIILLIIFYDTLFQTNPSPMVSMQDLTHEIETSTAMTQVPSAQPMTATPEKQHTEVPTLIEPVTEVMTEEESILATKMVLETAKPEDKQNIPSIIRELDGMEMVYVPAGEFIYGYSQTFDVHLDAFWIDKFEVTNKQYELCVADGVCSAPYQSYSNTRNNYYGSEAYADFPVIYVDRGKAVVYCNWAGGRLPTDAEWEKTARGTEGWHSPWGIIMSTDDLANYASHYDPTNSGDTTAVGSYPMGASPYGAMDMVGNVSEWIFDWYQENWYESKPSDNPTGPKAGEHRYVRGGSFMGSWFSPPIFDRTYILHILNDVGFRCVISE